MQTRHSVRPAQALAATLLAAALALAGCSGGANDTSNRSDSGAKAAAPGAAQAGAADSSGKAARAKAPQLTADHIIRTASLTVQVRDVAKALDNARTTAENAGGFVGDETTTRDGKGHEHTRVVLRVPTGKYDEVLAGLEGAGRLVDRTAKAQDVTDQVVDVESRIKSGRASVARVRELMNRATKIGDVVTLEGELSSRESDLEALLAQQASLEDRTSLATITLSLSETPVKKATKDESPGFVDALAGGWNAFTAMLRWVAVALGAALPFAAGAALLVLVWTRFVRLRAARRPAAAAVPATTGSLPVAPPAQGEQD